jgi:O-acetyl-ADP-ribose deacetylase (regulator of RNase III)
MPAPIKIFICYKKVLEQDNIKQRNFDAATLYELLNEKRGDQPAEYEAWLDKSNLDAGVEWETEIYRQIMKSDVLLALIKPGTSKSPWVEREISLANALGIAVVPIGSGLNEDALAEELAAVGIPRTQGKITRSIEAGFGDALRKELRPDLAGAAERTRKQQEGILNDLLQARNYELLRQKSDPDPRAQDNQKAATFPYKTISIHVATGDISTFSGIDVLVNSENNYMQMARFFESRTVSAIIRRRGARIGGGRYDDAVQDELDHHLRDRFRPLAPGEVVITGCGQPDSDLATENKAKYILHVAAVEAVESEARVVPYKQPYQIAKCVRESLKKISEINEKQGVVSPENTTQRAEQQKRAEAGHRPVNSIIFPIFGSGHGGSPVDEVLPAMFSGIEGFFADGDSQSSALSDIYISAFKQRDAEQLTKFLQRKLGPPKPVGMSA